MKTVKRILAVFGLIFFLFAISYLVYTAKEVDFEQSTMFVEYWHGLFCYEKSEIEAERVFPLSEEGRNDMYNWLKEHV